MICALFLQGCASLYGTQEERIALNKALPDYILCERLAFAILALGVVRTEWAMELHNRGKDCSAYAATFAAQSMQNSANTATLLNYSTQMLRVAAAYVWPTNAHAHKLPPDWRNI